MAKRIHLQQGQMFAAPHRCQANIAESNTRSEVEAIRLPTLKWNSPL
jgi:hypothetical protein